MRKGARVGMHTDSPKHSGRPAISLKLGTPDPTTLATPELRAAMARALDAPDVLQGLQYGPEEGTRSLIDFLVERISRDQGFAIEPAQVMAVAGSTPAVDMLARLYARPGGVVLIEAPTYPQAIQVFHEHHLELQALPMDADGLLVPALEEQLAWLKAAGKRPSFLYTIPTFHNPTGSTVGEARRRAILALAHTYDFLIVEDDVYRGLTFAGPVPPSYHTLARGQHTCSIGSFSKTLAPGLRLGWIVASKEVIQHCIDCGTTQMGGGASPFSAQLVAQYCCSGAWEQHILRLRTLYRTRRDLMLSALERAMPPGVAWTRPEGGYFLWVTLPSQVRAQEVTRIALEAGVSLAAGDA